MPERLQKFLSAAGVASRRHAERFIADGRVKVNGKTVRELGIKVDAKKDRVEVDGKKISLPEKYVYLAMNKPVGFVSSRADKYGKPTVYQLLPNGLRKKVWSIGRLDFSTDGLLVFTNDGELTQILSHPKYEKEKEYEVRVNRKFSAEDKKLFENGVNIGGYLTAPAKLKIISARVLRVVVREGRKRQIRRMFATLNYDVLKLTRIREGKLSLVGLNLSSGEIKEIKKNDII